MSLIINVNFSFSLLSLVIVTQHFCYCLTLGLQTWLRRSRPFLRKKNYLFTFNRSFHSSTVTSVCKYHLNCIIICCSHSLILLFRCTYNATIKQINQRFKQKEKRNKKLKQKQLRNHTVYLLHIKVYGWYARLTLYLFTYTQPCSLWLFG